MQPDTFFKICLVLLLLPVILVILIIALPVLFCLFLLVVFSCRAQNPFFRWRKTFSSFKGKNKDGKAEENDAEVYDVECTVLNSESVNDETPQTVGMLRENGESK